MIGKTLVWTITDWNSAINSALQSQQNLNEISSVLIKQPDEMKAIKHFQKTLKYPYPKYLRDLKQTFSSAGLLQSV